MLVLSRHGRVVIPHHHLWTDAKGEGTDHIAENYFPIDYCHIEKVRERSCDMVFLVVIVSGPCGGAV